MFNKLSFKIGLLFFIFILILEIFLFLILYTNLANERVNEVMDSLLARGNTHRDVLEDNFDSTTLYHVSLMESASEFTVVITDEKCKVIVASSTVDEEMKHVIAYTNKVDVSANGEIVEERWKREKYIATDSPIIINGAHKGHVYMFADTAYVEKIVSHLSDQFIMSGLIIIMLTITTIFILSRFVTKPLIKMKEATEQLIQGKTTVMLQIDRKDELGELAKSITKLAHDLEEMKTARNEFLASISHELRTPLTYIKGYADIVARPEASKEEIKEYTGIIKEATGELTELIRGLFELARLDENKFLIKRERIFLSEVIQNVEHLMTPVFVKKDITLYTKCTQEIITFIDPERFQQVLINILDNAQKHSFYGGEVLLEVVENKQHIHIVISDHGEGIPEDDLPYIFDRLYRVEKSRSRASGGSGLGLAIAKEIVEAHDGVIKATSTYGEGTSIIIELSRGEPIA